MSRVKVISYSRPVKNFKLIISKCFLNWCRSFQIQMQSVLFPPLLLKNIQCCTKSVWDRVNFLHSSPQKLCSAPAVITALISHWCFRLRWHPTKAGSLCPVPRRPVGWMCKMCRAGTTKAAGLSWLKRYSIAYNSTLSYKSWGRRRMKVLVCLSNR